MTHELVRELKRRIERLSAERIELFAHSGDSTSNKLARERLKTIERELDECYLAVRETRAVRDAERFVGEDRSLRGRLAANPAPGR